MTEDYLNGLDVVPLDTNHSIHSLISSIADVHPWHGLYLDRPPPPIRANTEPHSSFVPKEYKTDGQLIGPSRSKVTVEKASVKQKEVKHVKWQHTVRLCDVQAFRKSTATKFSRDVNNNSVAGLNARFSRLSTSSPSIRPVIYRYIDVIKDSFALLEAIHFELFMPDRSDLRFLAVQVAYVPSNTVEGDYLHLSEAYPIRLSPYQRFAVRLGMVVYPVIWEVNQLTKISSQDEREGLAYIIKKASCGGGLIAISDTIKEDLFIRDNLFPNEESRSEHSVVRITFKNMSSTANLFPVEPLPAPPQLTDEKKTEILSKLSHEQLDNVYKSYTDQPSNPRDYDKTLEWFSYKTGAQLMRVLFELGHSPVDPVSEYLKRVGGVCTSAQRNMGVVSAVRALSATEADWMLDRLGDFTKYGQTGDLELMNQYFRLGSRFRNRAQAGLDENDGYTWINESLVLKTLMEEMRCLEDCRPLMDSIYGGKYSRFDSHAANPFSGHPLFSSVETIRFKDGSMLRLNDAQSHAVRQYADKYGPRVFCIRSPPGSGKTATAVAMATKIYRGSSLDGDLQLLLAVQNVAVDNMGHQLKKIDCIGGGVYNMKTKKLNPHILAPYDFFDLMKKHDLEDWKKGKVRVPDYDLKNSKKRRKKFSKRQKTLEEHIIEHRREYEKVLKPKILLATVEMAIHKRINESHTDSMMAKVKRIIIDEASLLTEAALYAIIRRFPQARIVLIGDEKQLPPYQYDPAFLGQELAGRSALSVAMKNARMPVVNMNEVYRAPPSLITPYNKLAYDNKLISRKDEGEAILCKMDLVCNGFAQMLLINVNGRDERDPETKSLSNSIEIDAVVRLLKKYFPPEWAKDVMVICLYKDQKLKVDKILNGHQEHKRYTVLTVDSAQGKEAPIVILLTTRTEKASPFFCNVNRCNVAVSRQQKALIIMGKASFLTDNEPWKTVLNNGNFPQIQYTG